MIARLLTLLEWGLISFGAVLASAAASIVEMSIAAAAVICAALVRQLAHGRAKAELFDDITAALHGVARPANDGGRHGR